MSSFHEIEKTIYDIGDLVKFTDQFTDHDKSYYPPELNDSDFLIVTEVCNDAMKFNEVDLQNYICWSPHLLESFVITNVFLARV